MNVYVVMVETEEHFLTNYYIFTPTSRKNVIPQAVWPKSLETSQVHQYGHSF